MAYSGRPVSPREGFRAKRLINIADLSDSDIAYILSLAAYYAGYLERREPAPRRLAGRTQVNLFFEDSTRTNLSFALAGSKLGADVINVPVSASSVHKGEGLIDTSQTLAAMGADVVILRTREEGLHESLETQLPCAIINGGAGASEHPTQALLDAVTIRAAYGEIRGLNVAICGDIKHSRVAGSNTVLLSRLGANVRFVGPANLMPNGNLFPDIERYDDLQSGLAGVDIAMALRMQFERMADGDADLSLIHI